jgi:hypothetical protein
MMGILRRAAAAVVATTALVGCALISGASDLTVGASDGDGSAPTSPNELDGASAADAPPVVPTPDASPGPTDGAVGDARPADGGDGGGRLRDVTFEDGTLVGIHGGDSAFGNGNVISFNVIADAHSMRIDKSPSGIQVDIPAQNELFATALVRLDNFNGGPTALFGIVPEVGGTLAEIRVDDGVPGAIQLSLAIGGSVVGSGGSVTVGTVYRVGIHVKQDVTTHLIEIFAAAPASVFGLPVVRSTMSMLGRSVGIRMGVLDSVGGINNVKATFDNLFVDKLAMPPP